MSNLSFNINNINNKELEVKQETIIIEVEQRTTTAVGPDTTITNDGETLLQYCRRTGLTSKRCRMLDSIRNDPRYAAISGIVISTR